jgi:hypothetical protein
VKADAQAVQIDLALVALLAALTRLEQQSLDRTGVGFAVVAHGVLRAAHDHGQLEVRELLVGGHPARRHLRLRHREQNEVQSCGRLVRGSQRPIHRLMNAALEIRTGGEIRERAQLAGRVQLGLAERGARRRDRARAARWLYDIGAGD